MPDCGMRRLLQPQPRRYDATWHKPMIRLRNDSGREHIHHNTARLLVPSQVSNVGGVYMGRGASMGTAAPASAWEEVATVSASRRGGLSAAWSRSKVSGIQSRDRGLVTHLDQVVRRTSISLGMAPKSALSVFAWAVHEQALSCSYIPTCKIYRHSGANFRCKSAISNAGVNT